ncbi:MAG: hypothetical protein Q7S89_03290 [bacterium]|nr:hypothetical protein [bacterium]
MGTLGGRNRREEFVFHLPLVILALAGIALFVGGIAILQSQAGGKVLGIVQTTLSGDDSKPELITQEDLARSIILTDAKVGPLVQSKGVTLESHGSDPKGRGWLFQALDSKGKTLLWILVENSGMVTVL